MIPLYYMEEKILKTTTAQQQNGSKFETWENRQQHWWSTKRMNEFLFSLLHGKSDENEERKRINWYDIYIHWRRRRKKNPKKPMIEKNGKRKWNTINKLASAKKRLISDSIVWYVCVCVKERKMFLFFFSSFMMIMMEPKKMDLLNFRYVSIKKKNMKAMCFWETKSFV